MKLVQFSTLAALSLGLAAGSVQASPDRQVEAFVNGVRATAEQSIDLAGFDMTHRSMSVRVYVDSDGRLTRPNVLRSSGSAEMDVAVGEVLRRVAVRPPTDLIGAQLTLTLGGAAGGRSKVD
jgi:TonB family protein